MVERNTQKSIRESSEEWAAGGHMFKLFYEKHFPW